MPAMIASRNSLGEDRSRRRFNWAKLGRFVWSWTCVLVAGLLAGVTIYIGATIMEPPNDYDRCRELIEKQRSFQDLATIRPFLPYERREIARVEKAIPPCLKE